MRVDKIDLTGIVRRRTRARSSCTRCNRSERRSQMGDSRGPKIAGSSERILIPGTGIELPVDFDLSRRDMLKIAGYGSLAAFIAACGGTTPTTPSGSVTANGGSMSIGSYLSDAVPKKGLQATIYACPEANGGLNGNDITVDQDTFH